MTNTEKSTAIAVVVAGITALWIGASGFGGSLYLNEEPAPEIDPETHRAYHLLFTPPLDLDPTLNYRILFSVTPAIYEWSIGTNHYEAEEVDVSWPGTGWSDEEALRVKIQIPIEWECAELTARTHQLATQEELDAALAAYEETGEYVSAPGLMSETSNALMMGNCPDPMPERIPIATPEAPMWAGMVAALVALAGLNKLRKRSKA